MTKAAKAFGKKANDFLRLPSTLEYHAALVEASYSNGEIFPPLTEPRHPMDDSDGPLCSWVFQSKKGRYGGTFCHPKLAVFFARWLSVEFEVWCDLMIDNILQGNIQTTVVVPTEEALKGCWSGLSIRIWISTIKLLIGASTIVLCIHTISGIGCI